MFKPSEAKTSCLHILKGSNIPFLIGGTGVGKSAIVKEIAEELANDRNLTDSVSPKDDEFTVQQVLTVNQIHEQLFNRYIRTY